MRYSAARFFAKYTGAEAKNRKSLVWIAQRLGYSPTYVRKVKVGMVPVTEAFIGRAAVLLGENAEIFVVKDNSATHDLPSSSTNANVNASQSK
jgi:hypothetical protein